jgi:hypothetical protein
MKTVYEAANGVEAHMMMALLQQQGIASRIDGEYLQGGVGELPASGLVRVVVDEADFDAARGVVDAFEAAQPPASITPPPPSRPSRALWAGLGIVVGALLAWTALRVPATDDGVDHDQDGELDERWEYSTSGQPLRVDSDRNFDHRVDYVAHYERGSLANGQSDDDFDGRFESRLFFRRGNLERSETDVDGDGFHELTSNFRHGVLDSSATLDPASGLALRVEHFKLGQLTIAEQDTDRDGKLDTRFRYGPLGEVTSRGPM